MGLFQIYIYERFEGFVIVHAYIDNLLVITKHDFVEYLKTIEIFPENIIIGIKGKHRNPLSGQEKPK